MSVLLPRRDAFATVRNYLLILEHIRSGKALGIREQEQLALQCGISSRTVRRYIAKLEQEHLIESGSKKGEYRLRASTIPQGAGLGAEDALALAMARALLLREGMPMQEVLDGVFRRATVSLSPTLRRLADRARDAIRTSPYAYDYGHVSLPLLLTAIENRETLRIDYETRSRGGERTWRRLDPYQLEENRQQGRFYLHGWCHRSETFKTFSLARLHSVHTAQESFRRREKEWHAYLSAQGIVGGLRGGALIHVDVSFSPEVAAYALERAWPEGLRITRTGDGGAQLTGHAAGTQGILLEVLRWRRYAHVNGGPELRAAIEEEIREMSRNYLPTGHSVDQ